MFNFFKKKSSKESGRLIGQELIDKVKDLDHLSKTEIAIACGYYRVVDGETYPCFFEFYTAVLDSKGTSLGLHRNSKGTSLGPHRKLSYRAMVQGNGNMVIGKAYTAMLDLHPGDEFDIKLGKDFIRLTRVDPLNIQTNS
jgi:hypothetical protein